MADTNLGFVFTVINNKPHKFMVTARELGPDSIDKHNLTPYVYLFEGTGQSDVSQNIKFAVRIKLMLKFSYFKEIKEMHESTIKFGLYSIKNQPTESKFTFDIDDYKKFKAIQLSTGKELKNSILRFYYNTYNHWPDQKISIYDIMDNHIATEADIRIWHKNLLNKNFIQDIRGFKEYRLNRNTIRAKGYTINPEKENEVVSFLDSIKTIILTNRKNNSKPINVFLSYSTKNKKTAGSLKHDLEKCGLKVFLAHEDIDISEKWEKIILQKLETCDLFIPIITDNFLTSKWTDQESGHAIGSGKIIIPIMKKGNPHGFLNKFQGCKIGKGGIKGISPKIVKAISTNANLAQRFKNGLIDSFGKSKDFNDAIEKTRLLVLIKNYSKKQISTILNHFKENDQIHNSNGACKELRSFIESNKHKINSDEYSAINKLI